MSASDKPGQSDELQAIDALRLDLDTLEEGTHHRNVALPVEWLREVLAETDASASEPGVARLEITLQIDRTILVRGRIEAGYEIPCARCLSPARVDVDAEIGDLCLTFMPKERVRVWTELPGLENSGDDMDIEPLSPEELDEIPYEGEVVDLRPALAEQILLTYPMRMLCSRGEACRGLCQRCGFDVNQAPADATRCPSCNAPFDGSEGDESDTPWKRALAKVNSPKS